VEFHVSEEYRGLRLDHFLSAQAQGFSRSRIQRLIQSGHVLLNGARTKPGAKIHANDIVALDEPPPVPDENLPEEMPLEILHEDDDILVLNKPAGLVVHPAAGNRQHTLVNALLHHCKNLSGIGGSQRPGIVHRLDKETSGCLVVAKNDAAHQNLSRQFSGREVLKIYLALAQGRLKKEKGVIETSIGRHPVHRKKMAVVDAARGRAAKTEYRVVGIFGGASLVECRLHTGRTHQIRVHLKHIGHPLLGDKLYGTRTSAAHSRQMLHAWKLGFSHPRTGRWMEYESPIPRDFAEAAPGIC
jgi:23S rRNA pseudouridine1911/1915/1917 synthase